jgi:hypothetical protein
MNQRFASLIALPALAIAALFVCSGRMKAKEIGGGPSQVGICPQTHSLPKKPRPRYSPKLLQDACPKLTFDLRKNS